MDHTDDRFSPRTRLLVWVGGLLLGWAVVLTPVWLIVR